MATTWGEMMAADGEKQMAVDTVPHIYTDGPGVADPRHRLLSRGSRPGRLAAAYRDVTIVRYR